MRWFLDMCIILYYVGEGDRTDLNRKAKKFVKKKGKDSFLLCYYIKEINLPKWLKRQKIVFRELTRQINDKEYEPYSSEDCKVLRKRDRKKIQKLIVRLRKEGDEKEIVKKIEKVFQILERRINRFLEEEIDEFVVSTREIDFKLKSCLFTWLTPNDSDARTIASAVQEHNDKELVILTADKKDWNKDLLSEIHNDIYLKKKYSKLPEIRYLQDY